MLSLDKVLFQNCLNIKNYFTIFYQKLIKKIVQNYKSMVKGISTHQKLNKKIKVKNE